MVTHLICILMAWLRMNCSAKHSSPLSKINFKTCPSLLENKYKLTELLACFLNFSHAHTSSWAQWKSLVLKFWTKIKKETQRKTGIQHILRIWSGCVSFERKKFHSCSWRQNREYNLKEVFSWRGNVEEWYVLSCKRKNLQQLDGLTGVCCTLVQMESC